MNDKGSTDGGNEALVAAGSAAIEAFFASRNITPAGEGDGRYTVYVPLGAEVEERLQASFASTPRSAGILARVKAMRVVPRENFPSAMVAANAWNRRNPVPRAVVAPRGEGSDGPGVVLLEAWLPASAELASDQVARFVDAVLGGSRRFWSSERIRGLATPVGPGDAA